jgi:NADH-quinone oxidoreductase subunit J
MYALMKADFIFVIQILVYVGGILVLIIFAVMLTHKIVDVNVSNESTPTPWAVVAATCLLITLVALTIWARSGWNRPGGEAAMVTPQDNVSLTQVIGKALMSEYLYPFEIISVLLLACLIGAAYLARKEVRS